MKVDDRLRVVRTSALAVVAAVAVVMPGVALANTGDPFPPVAFPADNPFSDAKALLGKELFFDVRMSSNNTIACGSCHLPEVGGSGPMAPNPGRDGVFTTADDVFGALGIHGQTTGRKAPSSIAAMFFSTVFWDGRAGPDFFDPTSPGTLVVKGGALEDQGTKPQFGPTEMAFEVRTWAEILTKLATLSGPHTGTPYPMLFDDAFGSPAITAARIGMAIATYERTLLPTTPFHRMAATGDRSFLTASELRGWELFRGKGRCNKCHTNGEDFSDGGFHNIGVEAISSDPGRFNVTGRKKDLGAFKTPTLLNVGLQERYFHSGKFTTLAEVVDFYDRGGDFHENQDALIRPLGLTAGERADLVSFLSGALTDPDAAGATGLFAHVALGGEVADPADVTDPMVSIDSPSLVPALNGIVKFKIGVLEDQNAKRVRISIDAGAAMEDIARPFEFLVDTRLLTNMMHTIDVTAEDFGGNTAMISAMFTVNNAAGFIDAIAPEILSILPDGKQPVGNTVNLSASVFDNIGVTSVDYFVDAMSVATGTTGPDFKATFNSRNFSNGMHTLRAIANDARGNASDPFIVPIRIDNATAFPVTAVPFAAEGAVGLEGEFELTGSFRSSTHTLRFVGLGLPAPTNPSGRFTVLLSSPLGDITVGTVRPNSLGNITTTLRPRGNFLKRGFVAEELELLDGATVVGSGPLEVEVLIDGVVTVSTRINGRTVSFRTLLVIEAAGPGEGAVEAEVTSANAPAGDYVFRFEATNGNVEFGVSHPGGALAAEFESDEDILTTIGTFQRVRVLFNGVSVGTRTISVR